MKMTKVMVCLVAVCALTSCSESVDSKKFEEAAKNVEKHEYKSATIKYLYDYVINGEKTKTEGKIDYTYNNGSWTTDTQDSRADSFAYALSDNVSNFKATDMNIPAQALKYKPTIAYYLNPFKVEIKIDEKVEEDGAKGYVKLVASETFNKYGYMTKTITKFDLEAKGESSLGVSIEETMHINVQISASYKD